MRLMSSAKKIVHCDCDCFYASIEIRDNPELAGKPVAVGGSPEKRGVVATCNYEARKFGIHSAMASATARKRCPQLIIIKPDMEKYRAASQQIHQVFQTWMSRLKFNLTGPSGHIWALSCVSIYTSVRALCAVIYATSSSRN